MNKNTPANLLTTIAQGIGYILMYVLIPLTAILIFVRLFVLNH